jgi:peptidoglycan/LPS O-acetylase OafA/YrhL
VKSRLPGLDGLRALAALGITVHHFAQIRFVYGLPNIWTYVAVERLGQLCVSLFFVLSGFLITYLLLNEQRERGHISLKRFYIRRVLRIWPVYIVITLLGFFVLPFLPAYSIPNFPPVLDGDFWNKFALYAVFMPQVEASLLPPVNYAGVLWSVGVEEWFYVCWPFLLMGATKRTWFVLPAIVIGLMVARHEFQEGAPFYLLTQIRFDCMAIGALGAILVTSRPSLPGFLMRSVFSRAGQVVMLCIIIGCVGGGVEFGAADELVYSTLFLWLIVNVAINQGAIFSLDHSVLKWLGDRSYAMYCFNWITLVSSLVILRWSGFDLSARGADILNFLFGLAITVAVAALSYRYLERPFLAWKIQSFSAAVPLQISSTVSPQVSLGD